MTIYQFMMLVNKVLEEGDLTDTNGTLVTREERAATAAKEYAKEL